MADIKDKNKEEEERIDRFLSSEEALHELKNSSTEDIAEIMKYGIKSLQPKTPGQLAKDFIKLATLYPNKIRSRDISKIIKNIDIENNEDEL